MNPRVHTPGDASAELRHLKRERTQLQGRLDASATVIAALHHDNAALRQQLDTQTGTVVTIGPPRSE